MGISWGPSSQREERLERSRRCLWSPRALVLSWGGELARAENRSNAMWFEDHLQYDCRRA